MTNYKNVESTFKELIVSNDSLKAANFVCENQIVGDQLLYGYFKNLSADEQFEIALSVSNPRLLIDGIRLSAAFICEKHRSRLLQIQSHDKEFQLHQTYWKKLYSEDESCWSKITSLKEKWNNLEAAEVLSNLVNWIESKRFENEKASIQNLHQLAGAYNFIIALYLSENYSKTESLSEDKFWNAFSESLKKPNTDLTQLFNLVNAYVSFRDDCLNAYCYDLNVKPKITNGALDIAYYDEAKMENWRKDGMRYFKNEERYLISGVECTDYLIQNKKLIIPVGKTEKDYKANLKLVSETQAVNLFLQDIHLNKILINRNEYNTNEILQPIITYSFNRQLRYEVRLNKFRTDSKSWQENFAYLKKDGCKNGYNVEPYFFMTENEYIEFNLKANSPQQQNVYKEIIQQFSKTINEKYRFNRHQKGYDVWQTPFIKLGDFLFCPMIFFANNKWFYSTAELIIKSYKKNHKLRKSSSIEMEEHLKQLFDSSNNQWKSTIIPPNNEQGDIDLVVEDNHTQLLIQLKRTYFRTNLKDAFFEVIQSDRKAAYQLLKAEEHYNKNESEFKLKENNVKWIVSTSFEGINQNINGCRKINYLDLLWALRHRKFNALQELIDYMKNDNIL